MNTGNFSDCFQLKNNSLVDNQVKNMFTYWFTFIRN